MKRWRSGYEKWEDDGWRYSWGKSKTGARLSNIIIDIEAKEWFISLTEQFSNFCGERRGGLRSSLKGKCKLQGKPRL